MKHLISLEGAHQTQLEALLALAGEMKHAPDRFTDALRGKTVGLFFQKPSTRMRFAFEVGALQLGGHTTVFRTSELQLARGESVADTARVLSSYLDAIVIRGRSHQDLLDFAQFGRIPVINGLTVKHYPVGAICAAFTLNEHFGRLAGLKIAYVGDGNNIAHSLMLLAPKLGMDLAVVTPEWYEPSPDVTRLAGDAAKEAGTVMTVTTDRAAVAGADVVFTDVWTSIGMEEEREERIEAFQPYQVNRELLALTGKDPVLLHCMPVRKGEEIASDVDATSLIYENAANLLPVAKAILFYLLKEEK